MISCNSTTPTQPEPELINQNLDICICQSGKYLVVKCIKLMRACAVDVFFSCPVLVVQVTKCSKCNCHCDDRVYGDEFLIFAG